MNEAKEAPRLEWASQWTKTTKTHYIHGEWVSPPDRDGTWIDSINPANGTAFARIAAGDPAVVEQAVRAARRAFDQGPWPTMPRAERARLLRRMGEVVQKHQAELATLESLDNGMLWSEAYDGNLPDCSTIFDYYAGWVDKLYGETVPVDQGFLNYTLRQPVGVCGLIVPWNFPLLLALWKLAPALATGNTVVIKPSSATSLSLVRFFEIVTAEVALPPGVMNLVLGSGQTGNLIAEHPGVDKISFTGSTQVGKSLVHASANSNLKVLTLELGGKSPNILFDDVPDLQGAIDRSFQLTFSQKGEKCSEPTRLFVHEKHYDRVCEAMIEKAKRVRCGSPFDRASDQGPQCTKAHMESILRYIDIGRQEGARLVVGGERDTSGDNQHGYFVRPTIFADVDNRMRIAQEEIFGPVLCVHRFKDEEDVIRQANDTVYGLAAGLWTRDVSRAHRVAARLQAGMVFVNRYGCYDFASPFGGLKQSGWGKEMARHSLDAYTQVKSIWVAL